jgi:hypothetical protein
MVHLLKSCQVDMRAGGIKAGAKRSVMQQQGLAADFSLPLGWTQ